MREKVAFSWSGGKDSALALHKVLKEGIYEVVILLTNVNEHYKRISMHGVREDLLDQQASSIGIPLKKLYLSKNPDNNEYESKISELYNALREQGLTKIVHGDIYLEDLKAYRDKTLNKHGLSGIYPLWYDGANIPVHSKELINTFINIGFKAITCCVDSSALTEAHVGKQIDKDFINSLPRETDVCGENGEYHSFVFDGPIFKHPITFKVGEKVFRPLTVKTEAGEAERGFWFIDMSPE